MEFSKGNKFIICNDNYNLKILNIDSIKKTFIDVKLFTNKIKEILIFDKPNT